MKLVTLKISNSHIVSFLKTLCPPFIWNFLYKKLIIKNIPNAEFYSPHYSPWLENNFSLRVEQVHKFTGLSSEKLYILQYFARATFSLTGDLAELGVWKGGGAKFIADIFRSEYKGKKTFFLFDSFEGMKVVNTREDRHQVGDFSDTSLAGVEKLMNSPNKNITVVMKRGWVPLTFSGLESQIFSFVHIDLDLYEPIKDALNFIYPRLNQGGVIVFDDYGYASCPGARKAVDDFSIQSGENVLVLSTGQAVLIKEKKHESC